MTSLIIEAIVAAYWVFIYLSWSASRVTNLIIQPWCPELAIGDFRDGIYLVFTSLHTWISVILFVILCKINIKTKFKTEIKFRPLSRYFH